MFVLGIDPGLTRCGYACIESLGPGKNRAVAMGVLRTPVEASLPERLLLLRNDLRSLISDYHPDAVAVERVFFQVNVRTAMSVGQASGLALVEALDAGCEVAQYSPNEVKGAIAGYGGADKAQVQKMVQLRLGLATPPKPADAADAAALALCHIATSPMRQRIAGSRA
jgi:crossover junction endodeoxyribonuclease RuvC